MASGSRPYTRPLGAPSRRGVPTTYERPVQTLVQPALRRSRRHRAAHGGRARNRGRARHDPRRAGAAIGPCSRTRPRRRACCSRGDPLAESDASAPRDAGPEAPADADAAAPGRRRARRPPGRAEPVRAPAGDPYAAPVEPPYAAPAAEPVRGAAEPRTPRRSADPYAAPRRTRTCAGRRRAVQPRSTRRRRPRRCRSSPVADLPAGLDPDELAAAPSTSARRGKLRRRVAFLRAARELLLRDLGGFVYELHRTAHDVEHEAHRRLRETKLARLSRIDAELHELEMRLDDVRRQVLVREPGVGGECPHCGELFGSAAHYCSNCGLPLTEGARRELARSQRAAARSRNR